MLVSKLKIKIKGSNLFNKYKNVFSLKNYFNQNVKTNKMNNKR